jgi:hypothetical protein
VSALGPRYSIIPGDFVTDERATLVHFRVLTALGRRINRAGWCRYHQSEIASAIGYSRQYVNATLKDLVEWGYVEKRGQSETNRNICSYRVLIDPQPGNPRTLVAVDDGFHEADDDVQDDGGQPVADDHTKKLDTTPVHTKISDTGVRSDRTPVSGLTRHLRNTPLSSPLSLPLAPEGAGGEGGSTADGGDLDWATGWAKGWSDAARGEVADLACNGVVAHVAVHFIAPVRGVLQPSPSVDAAAYVRQLRTRLRDFTPETLDRLAAKMIDTRARDLPSVADLVKIAEGLAGLIAHEKRRAGGPASASDAPTNAELAAGMLRLADALAANPEAQAAKAALSGAIAQSFSGQVLTIQHKTETLASVARQHTERITDAATFAFPGCTAVHIISRGASSAASVPASHRKGTPTQRYGAQA